MNNEKIYNGLAEAMDELDWDTILVNKNGEKWCAGHLANEASDHDFNRYVMDARGVWPVNDKGYRQGGCRWLFWKGDKDER